MGSFRTALLHRTSLDHNGVAATLDRVRVRERLPS